MCGVGRDHDGTFAVGPAYDQGRSQCRTRRTAGIQELAGDATMLYYFLDEAQEGGKAFLEKRKPDFKKYPKLP